MASPVVVPGEAVVEAKALRALPSQAHCHLGQQLRETVLQGGPANLLIVKPAELQALHEAAASRRRRASRTA